MKNDEQDVNWSAVTARCLAYRPFLLICLVSLWGCASTPSPNEMCSSDPLPGEVKGVKVQIEAKRAEFSQIMGSLQTESYKRLSQDLAGYDVQWQSLHDATRPACFDWAICRTRSKEVTGCEAEKKYMEEVRELARRFTIDLKRIDVRKVVMTDHSTESDLDSQKIKIGNDLWNEYHAVVDSHETPYKADEFSRVRELIATLRKLEPLNGHVLYLSFPSNFVFQG